MKLLFLSFGAAILLIASAVYVSGGIKKDSNISPPKNNVSIIDGTQVIEIVARGGYAPEKSVAKAGIPTVIKFVTSGTFDCSSAVRIPSLDVSLHLPPSGMTNVDLGKREVGVLHGVCAMGMYQFEIDFQ